MTPPPPRSTLFPSRRSSDLVRRNQISEIRGAVEAQARHRECASTRSEEHTSELQSRGHLVCRLLLEKKKCKACHADRRAYRRAQNGCEKSKLEYISRMIKDL